MLGCFDTSCLRPTVGTAAQTFSTVFQYLFTAQCLLAPRTIPEAEISDGDCFNFIIVGAGSAGCVVANRLSEVKHWNVLLVEAGDDPPVESNVPGLSKSLINSPYDWYYPTVNDGKTHKALINGSVPWPRGKMLGGCSSINGMVYMRGNDHDYENWCKAGNVEWCINDVKRSFKKAESLQDLTKLHNAQIKEFYGHDGPLVINKMNYSSPYTQLAVDMWNEMGFKKVDDLNVAQAMGSGHATVTAANGIRQSTNKAYLLPASKRSNLKILKNAVVNKVLIDKNNAYGIELEWRGAKMILKAINEVILSAGPIGSPQLLMLSGVGSASHLRSNNITCLVDSPKVGQDLMDHTIVPITIYADSPSQPTTAEKYFDVMNYLTNRQGSFSHSDAISDVMTFYSTKKNAIFPNIQNQLSVIPKNTTNIARFFPSIFGYNQTVMHSMISLNQNHSLWFLSCTLLHPYSSGNISLKSNDPKEYPLIFLNTFSDLRDLDTIVKGIKMVSKIVNTNYFKSVNAFLGRIDIPECNGLELDSEDYWKCISMNIATSVWHPIKTCQMGRNINISVVDSRLRVHGVKNLRVVDSGVMPGQISGNINGPTIMTGERGSDLIKEDYGMLL